MRGAAPDGQPDEKKDAVASLCLLAGAAAQAPLEKFEGAADPALPGRSRPPARGQGAPAARPLGR